MRIISQVIPKDFQLWPGDIPWLIACTIVEGEPIELQDLLARRALTQGGEIWKP